MPCPALIIFPTVNAFEFFRLLCDTKRTLASNVLIELELHPLLTYFHFALSYYWTGDYLPLWAAQSLLLLAYSCLQWYQKRVGEITSSQSWPIIVIGVLFWGPCPPDLHGYFLSITKPDGICNPSTMFWVCAKVFFRLDVPGIPAQGCV